MYIANTTMAHPHRRARRRFGDVADAVLGDVGRRAGSFLGLGWRDVGDGCGEGCAIRR
jgi:hypothetical protein